MRVRTHAALSAQVLCLLCAAAPAPAQGPHRPDLIIDPNWMSASWNVGMQYFAPGDCAIEEGCVLGPGVRTLLQFTVQTANLSQHELVLGDPTNSPFFVFSPCHGHFHLLDFSDYQLRDLGGGPLVAGQKYDWCLADTDQYIFEPWVPAVPIHDCDYQGLLPGWSDVYGNRTPCQWVDVTGVPPGDYLLSATVNAAGRIQELDYSNNTSTVIVTIPSTSGSPDLVVLPARMASTWSIEKRFFNQSDPAVVDGCLGRHGYRRILKFGAEVANIGVFDFFIGDPAISPQADYAASHNHYHLHDFMEYRLFSLSGSPVTPARAQETWYPFDHFRHLTDAWARPIGFYSPYLPPNWGLQRGWRHEGPAAGAACQWVDVTEVPDGTYLLRATVNPRGVFPETVLSNNSADVQVTVAEPPGGVLHVPDGVVSQGTPVSVRSEPGGLRVTWDVTTCRTSKYNLHYSLRPPSSESYDASICDVGSSGSALVNLPTPGPGQLLWFVIVGVEGTVEGGHGFDSLGRERPLSGVGRCGVTQSLPGPICRVFDG